MRCAFLGGVLSAAAAVQAGLAAAAVPAFGLGIGAGWFLFVVGCAWRALKHGVPQVLSAANGSLDRARRVGLRRCWVFWVDAQVNIPVLTTRLISFAIAAFILIMADGFPRNAVENAGSESAPEENLWVWGVACSLVAGCAICLPVFVFDAGTGVQEAHGCDVRCRYCRSCFIAAWAAWSHARRDRQFQR